MKNRKVRHFDRDFDSYKNQTICYIHLMSIEEIPVAIERKDNVFLLSFKFRNKLYKSDEIIINNTSDYVRNNLSRIKFPEIVLNEIDLNNVALCIDKIVDELYR